MTVADASPRRVTERPRTMRDAECEHCGSERGRRSHPENGRAVEPHEECARHGGANEHGEGAEPLSDPHQALSGDAAGTHDRGEQCLARCAAGNIADGPNDPERDEPAEAQARDRVDHGEGANRYRGDEVGDGR